MKRLRRFLIMLLISILAVNVIPVQSASAATKYGIILGSKANVYTLYNNLTVMSPEANIMVKVYNLSKALGLTYSYNSETKKLTIKNPTNGKYLVFTRDSKTYSYYSSKTAAAAIKTATYKFYYDNTTKSNVIHASTLKYIVNYYYYKDATGGYYGEMGYKGILSYSINGYSTYDMPITNEVLDYVNAKTFTSGEELLDAVRLNMLARRSGITFVTNRATMEEIGSGTSIMDAVLAMDNKDTSKDADYLSLLINNLKQSWRSTSTKYSYPDGREEIIKSPSDPASLTIAVSYETTLDQERIVDNKVASILKSLKLNDASDYEKVKKIHDYVINLASYDKTYTRSSAYELLVNKSSVCEGYTLSAYRLFTDAGLETKIITGYGKGESHAWNIVKVNGEWYNIDLTWGDPISSTGAPILSYDYFLKSEKDFKYHDRLSEYMTANFLLAYPVAEESYPR